MPQGNPRTFEPPTTLPDSVIYDIFADTATRLGGKYTNLARHADTPEDKALWKAKSLSLRREKRAVDADDRTALIEHVNLWLTELEELN